MLVGMMMVPVSGRSSLYCGGGLCLLRWGLEMWYGGLGGVIVVGCFTGWFGSEWGGGVTLGVEGRRLLCCGMLGCDVVVGEV